MTGRITRVAGPLVQARDAGDVAMFDLVHLGPGNLPAEIVAVQDGVLTMQAYEYTGGRAPGESVRPAGHPLSARLGPHLLGGVFDGLLRPLSGVPARLVPGQATQTDTTLRSFKPSVHNGAEVNEGEVVGVVETGGLDYRILVPPGVTGRIEWLAEPGPQSADQVLARVGDTEITMTTTWPIRQPKPHRERVTNVQPLRTGQRVLDLLFPIARGGTAAVPGGFGTGKTVLLQQLAKWCDADVIVYVGCGERGNEMAEVVAELFELADPRRPGALLADRSVIIANTSNMPMMAREASIYTGVTVAEHFRDMGYDAIVIADSTSRWAEALREFASRTGALPAEEGYPANMGSALAAFYERAGTVRTLGGDLGSVTVVGAVSPPGGDMTEPVTALTERFVRCRWTLDRDLAYARHYPAVAWAGSYSLDADAVGSYHAANGDPEWSSRRAKVSGLLAEAARLADLAELIGVSALPGHERMVVLAGRLIREGVLQQSALSTTDASCSDEKAAALVDCVLAVVDACQRSVAAGTPAERAEELDFSPVLRAREETGPDDVVGVSQRRDVVLARLRELS
ncbi:V-type ATP synthase subunit A [Kibdelosporangium aridum]|uniref:V-type ATP synthase subunit A n=1 Tax=Kibdelosporangium aridum TaxID=2030 RepID=UPI0021ADCF8E|nr:V-type ATP synthase subunit A [Kibdelosporangium aridum]